MENFEIIGGKKLYGTVKIPSSKNAVLPILAASLLCDEKVVILDCPKISDIFNMISIIENLGCECLWEKDDLIIFPKINNFEIPENLAQHLRASIFCLGPLSVKFGKSKVAYPGGCAIGARPIDIHLGGLKKLGMQICEKNEFIYCLANDVKPADIELKFPSVGATENLIMASVLIPGKTTIFNAAKEPEVGCLIDFLNKCGANIKGGGTSTIFVEGVKRLSGCSFRAIPDRIVCGTYMLFVAATGGEVTIQNVLKPHIFPIFSILTNAGCAIKFLKNNQILISSEGRIDAVKKIITEPFPGFPTDLQSPILALQAVSNGKCEIVENLFETRFNVATELRKMGAKITIYDNTAQIEGVKCLQGCEVVSQDLRGGAALILAGLCAQGKTKIANISHILRGYENIENNLKNLGADIKRTIS